MTIVMDMSRHQGRGQSIILGGLEPRAWRAREREPITGVWVQSPQRGPGAEPLVRGSGGAKPPEAERFLGIIRRKDRQYLPLYPTFESAEISPKHCLESK